MAAKTAPGRPRRSRTEVQDEFDKIKEQAEREKAELNPKAEELSRQKEVELREAVKETTQDNIVRKIASLGLEVSKSLSELSSKLSAEAGLLDTLRDAVSLERKELERLHKADVCAAAFDQMIADYGQRKQALEAEIAQARGQWAGETERREAEQEEFEENLKKQRAREKEEYEYQKAVERKKDQDSYEESQRLLERKNKDKQEALEKAWQAREAALKEREDELNRLRKETADFPARLAKETEKAVAEALKAAEGKHSQELLLLGKDAEAERRVSELKIKSLEELAARQCVQIETLGQRLEEAKKQVQDIAIKAIDGASGAKALSHVSQLAMEQAKVRPGQS